MAAVHLAALLVVLLMPQQPAWLEDVNREAQVLFDKVAAEQVRFVEPAAPKDKEWVKRKLQHMVAVDQIARGAFENPKLSTWSGEARENFMKRAVERMSEIDRANTAELKLLLKTYRWFTVSEFGKEADKAGWLLVQHADHDIAFQQQVLAVLTELQTNGETSASNYAYLWDRVASNTGKKQRYGTQGRCVAPGTWREFDIEDPSNIDNLRASVGLPSMQVYRSVFKEHGLCP